jgi:hypothetical protein
VAAPPGYRDVAGKPLFHGLYYLGLADFLASMAFELDRALHA